MNRNQIKITTFVLKLTALSAMLLDHLQGSFPATFPIVFGWIGRMAIPLFMFCVIEGIVHTRNIKKYIFRLYMGSVIMAVGSFFLQLAFPGAKYPIADNFFATLFLLALVISLAKSKFPRNKKIGLWIGFLLVQIIGFLLIARLQSLSHLYAYLVNGLLPNILLSEGSVIFILLGILLYVFRNDKAKLAVAYSIFSLLLLISSILSGFTMQNIFFGNYQWLMILALPLMLFYNGEKGSSMKYVFYAFYPLHIWILFIIANFLQRK